MQSKQFRAGIITASDKGYRGERPDLSGPAAAELLTAAGFIVEEYKILPDEENLLKDEMIRMCDIVGLDLVITTGGTGFSSRDVTPEATMQVIERQTPGIAEALRMNSLKITPKGMLSRGISGIRGKTLIINLPGSPKSVRESLDYILDPVIHGLSILLGLDSECAR
ncbi:MAG: molybdenum cofactor biosynthesis protein [Firmicutes bacterium HGW-Firmicutes-11]|jgi:molybdenum cofactor synthesis domain-containing protein|nr:MAG: molybdenum cofactor biosynthesis protein [Firmicutes bacterium HGW-Firmicutes-11]